MVSLLRSQSKHEWGIPGRENQHTDCRLPRDAGRPSEEQQLMADGGEINKGEMMREGLTQTALLSWNGNRGGGSG